MKTLMLGLMALLPDVSGKYVSLDNLGYRLDVGKDLRIRTNIQALHPNGGGVPLHFPHRLKGEDGLFETRGYFTMRFVGLGGFAQCTFPVHFDGDFGTDATSVDVFFTAPRYYGVDGFGRCAQQGLVRQPFAFRRTGP